MIYAIIGTIVLTSILLLIDRTNPNGRVKGK